jgi:uncharacterized membrane protein YbhN (UPF0104 family)
MSRRYLVVLRPLVAVALLGVVVVSVDPPALATRLLRTDLLLASLAVLGLTAVHLLGALGWWGIMLSAGGAPRLRTLVLTYYIGQAIGGVTPANLGGDIYRMGVFRGAGWTSAVVPVIVQRATSYVALAAMGLGAFALLAADARGSAAVALLGVGGAVAVALAALVVVTPPAPLRGLQGRLVRRLFGSSPAADSMRMGRAWLVGLATGLTFHAFSVALTALLVVAVLGAQADAHALVPMLCVLTIARLSLAAPFTISGLGVQEAILVALAPATGVPASALLAAMLLARISLLLTTILGGVLLSSTRSKIAAQPGTGSDAPVGLGHGTRP